MIPCCGHYKQQQQQQRLLLLLLIISPRNCFSQQIVRKGVSVMIEHDQWDSINLFNISFSSICLSLSHPHTHILSLLVAHANTHSLSLSLSLECSPILCLTLLWFFLTATFNITNCLRKSLAHRYTVSTHQRFNGSVPITQASFMSISHLSLFLSFFLSFTYYLFLSLYISFFSFFHLLSFSFSLTLSFYRLWPISLFLSLTIYFFLSVSFSFSLSLFLSTGCGQCYLPGLDNFDNKSI